MFENLNGLRIILSLTVVLASIVGLSRLLRRTPIGDAHWMQRLDQLELEPGHRLHLVRILGQLLVLGTSSSGGVQVLATLDAQELASFEVSEKLACELEDGDAKASLDTSTDLPQVRALDAFLALGRIRKQGGVK